MTKMPQDGDAYAGDFGNPFPSAQDKLALVGEPKMAAPNKQPAGNRPGPKAPNTHGPVAGGQPASKVDPGNGGYSGGAGPVRPIKTTPTGKNKNRLH